MPTIAQRVLSGLRSGSLRLIATASGVLLLWGTLSPIGTLVWWLNEGSEVRRLRELLPNGDQQATALPQPNVAEGAIDCYIVYLTGVGDFSANQNTPGEEAFLAGLTDVYPNCVAVTEVFPYSAANEGLGGRRLLAPLWEFAEQADGWLGMADALIKIRNLWRFAISADDRYGPIYNQGIASAILDRMNAVHPIANARSLHVVLIGTSGGAEVALGAAPYLERWLNPQITVVSVGGVFVGDQGFDAADRVYHLQGSEDWVEDLGRLFPSRWRWAVNSPFNRARRANTYEVRSSGPHEHDGDRGYFGQASAPSTDATYVELTLAAVQQLPIWWDRRGSR